MKSMTVRKLKIGEGIPKICVPIVGKSLHEVAEQAEQIMKLPADLVEWRCDWYERADSRENVQEALRLLRDLLGEKPLLFTFRTAAEGGEKAISNELYVEMNQWAVDSGCVDLIDVELLLGDETMALIVPYAHMHGVKVVASNHDFEKTPPKDELLRRIQQMQKLGADVAKVAVMPNSEADVQVLLAATQEASMREERGAIVTMSMSKLGRVSRIEGEIYGSAITFGSAGESSAPGQIPVCELASLLREVHEKIYSKKVEKTKDLL